MKHQRKWVECKCSHFLSFDETDWTWQSVLKIQLSYQSSRRELNFQKSIWLCASFDINCDLSVLNFHSLVTDLMWENLCCFRPWRRHRTELFFSSSQNCKPSVIGQGVGDWLKEITRIDFFEAGEVSVPMVCQKIIAMNGKRYLQQLQSICWLKIFVTKHSRAK